MPLFLLEMKSSIAAPRSSLRDSVHVWVWDGGGVSIRKMEDALHISERAYASRFRSAKARETFLRGRFAVRTLLSHYLGQHRTSWIIATGKFGKPDVLMADRSLYFNLSHDEHCIVVALSAVGDVGVDVEAEPDSGAVAIIAEQHFSHLEREALNAGALTFSQIWTAKEAVLKASGDGITSWLKEVEVVCCIAGTIALAEHVHYRGKDYLLAQRQLMQRQVSVSAVLGRDEDVRKRAATFDTHIEVFDYSNLI